MIRSVFRAGTVVLAVGLAGCATYHPLALSRQSNLASGLAQLNLTLPPRTSNDPPEKLNPAKPLTPDQVGLVAVLNDPDLGVLGGRLAAANADLLTASLLPNPSIGLGYAILVSGPANADAYSASLSQDIRAIVTYKYRVAAAKSRVGQVGASSLWQEWQVAQKARLLAIDINSSDREIRFRKQELALLTEEVNTVQQATAAGNLTLAAEAPLFAAQASAQSDLAAARLSRLKDWQNLDALLGLRPTVRFAISAPPPVKLPDNIGPLIASLPSRRPDLVALRLGYDAAESDVRAAIIGQFPAVNLGVSGGSDTSHVVSVGPQVTFDLPIFNRNQGEIASSRATRLQLHADYLARLDQAEGMAQSLLARAHTAAANLAGARRATVVAKALLGAAERAYRQGNLDQRSLVDYETTVLDRELNVVGYQRTLEEDSLALSVELGLGLPQAMIPPPDAKEAHT